MSVCLLWLPLPYALQRGVQWIILNAYCTQFMYYISCMYRCIVACIHFPFHLPISQDQSSIRSRYKPALLQLELRVGTARGSKISVHNAGPVCGADALPSTGQWHVLHCSSPISVSVYCVLGNSFLSCDACGCSSMKLISQYVLCLARCTVLSCRFTCIN